MSVVLDVTVSVIFIVLTWVFVGYFTSGEESEDGRRNWSFFSTRRWWLTTLYLVVVLTGWNFLFDWAWPE